MKKEFNIKALNLPQHIEQLLLEDFKIGKYESCTKRMYFRIQDGDRRFYIIAIDKDSLKNIN